MTLVLATALLCASVPSAAGTPTSVAAGASPFAEAAEAARFGDWLAERGDYYRAIGEYQRAVFLDPDGVASDALELSIARAYAAGGKSDAAVRILRDLVRRGRDAAVREGALFEMGLVRYRAGDAEAAAAALVPYAALAAPAGGPGADRARLLLSLALLRKGDAPGARLALDGIQGGGALAADVTALRAAFADVEHAEHRSPVVAGVLSAVVPGLGHAYAGDARAGAGALVLNGLFVWATVDAFRDRRYGLGALLAVGESIWYGGAIFGAVAEAMRFNRDARSMALDRVDARFPWIVDALPGGATLGIRGAFDAGGRR